jgi:signal transduction histidine kinase
MADSALATFLSEHKDLLIQRWSRRVQRDPAIREGDQLAGREIRDHVPRLIERLCASLHRGVTHGELRGRRIGRCSYAKDYAHLRIEKRRSLVEVLRELSHFRMLLVESCSQEGIPLQGEEAKLIHAVLDESMSTVAVEMVDAAEGELRRAVEFRDRFMGVLGHDLRTPLSCVAFTAESLLQRPDTPKSYQKALHRIGSSAERMSRMINDLLDLTRVHGSGGIPITPQPIDLHSICRQMVDELEVSHPDRTILFDAQGDGRGVWDSDRLAQVVSNLVKNALDYSSPDTPIQVTVAEQGSFVVLEVTNLGTPIPREDMAVIFDPFRRGSRGPEHGRRPPGLGLGLFITQQIVKAHGGDITVRSSLDHGTTFTVQLPRSPVDPHALTDGSS